MKQQKVAKSHKLRKMPTKVKKRVLLCAVVLIFLLVVGISVFLIYLIPDCLEGLRTILTSIVAALFGGLLTLLGVAITIKKGERDRVEDERKKHIPYLNLVKYKDGETIAVTNDIEIGVIRRLKRTPMTEDVRLKYSYIFMRSIYVKNISNSCLILRGILINNRYVEFINNQLVEANGIAKIPRENLGYITYEDGLIVKLIVSDALRNIYYFDLEMELGCDKTVPYEEGKEKYMLTERRCVSKRISLPKVLEDKNLLDEIGNA